MLNEESRKSWNSFREDVFFFSKLVLGMAICSLNETGSALEECRRLIAFWKTIVMTQN
jgi:hypothetical protein